MRSAPALQLRRWAQRAAHSSIWTDAPTCAAADPPHLLLHPSLYAGSRVAMLSGSIVAPAGSCARQPGPAAPGSGGAARVAHSLCSGRGLRGTHTSAPRWEGGTCMRWDSVAYQHKTRISKSYNEGRLPSGAASGAHANHIPSRSARDSRVWVTPASASFTSSSVCVCSCGWCPACGFACWRGARRARCVSVAPLATQPAGASSLEREEEGQATTGSTCPSPNLPEPAPAPYLVGKVLASHPKQVVAVLHGGGRQRVALRDAASRGGGACFCCAQHAEGCLSASGSNRVQQTRGARPYLQRAEPACFRGAGDWGRRGLAAVVWAQQQPMWGGCVRPAAPSVAATASAPAPSPAPHPNTMLSPDHLRAPGSSRTSRAVASARRRGRGRSRSHNQSGRRARAQHAPRFMTCVPHPPEAAVPGHVAVLGGPAAPARQALGRRRQVPVTVHLRRRGRCAPIRSAQTPMPYR